MKYRLASIIAVISLSMAFLSACSSDSLGGEDLNQTPTTLAQSQTKPTPTATPQASPTTTATSTPEPTATDTPSPTPTDAPSPTPTDAPTPTPTSSPPPATLWRPAVNTSWQWQLSGTVDTSVDAAVYDIDGFDNSASVVADLHAKGRKVICYIDVGTYENWRSDASSFPSSVLGKSNGWPGEKWLDIRQLALLKPIIDARLDMCRTKGFDGVEPDNIDGYTNDTGFPLTAKDQLTFNTYLADAAHARGLAIGLKNDVDQVPDLVSHFDYAIDEQCFQYSECDTLQPFIQQGKPVFEVEYSLDTSSFCTKANALDFNSLKKHLSLDAYREACR